MTVKRCKERVQLFCESDLRNGALAESISSAFECEKMLWILFLSLYNPIRCHPYSHIGMQSRGKADCEFVSESAQTLWPSWFLKLRPSFPCRFTHKLAICLSSLILATMGSKLFALLYFISDLCSSFKEGIYLPLQNYLFSSIEVCLFPLCFSYWL